MRQAMRPVVSDWNDEERGPMRPLLQRRRDRCQWSLWKLTGLGGGGAGTSQSFSWMDRTGLLDSLLVVERVAFRLLKNSPALI